MRLAFVRVRSAPGPAAAGAAAQPRTGSSSKNLIVALEAAGFLSATEEWELAGGDGTPLGEGGRLPRRGFPSEPDALGPAVARHIARTGQPDILWVEGTAFPAALDTLFTACAGSFKIVYSKYWKPWAVERLERYDLCLLDEWHQEEEIRRRHGAIRCAVWDKLVDYDNVYRPIPGEKAYDICYVAYLRPRKNHDLLFRAMARLGQPLRAVCIGDDRKGNRAGLERLAADLGLEVEFTGELAPPDVNRCINRSRIGVMCSSRDAAPRAILEYMAADVPVLVNADLLAGARYIGESAGLVRPPDTFHDGIAELLDTRERYSPREYYLSRYSVDQVVSRFVRTLADAGVSRRASSGAAPGSGSAGRVDTLAVARES